MNRLDKDHFRNNLATADSRGKRLWVFPRKPKGQLTNWRNRLSYFQLAFLFIAPFLTFRGEQLILFNIFERKFAFFGLVFWPQDFYILVIAMIALFVAIALFTAVYGRIFCGWMCPQTIFLEMLFRKIEYAIDGNWTAQKKLDASAWNAKKIKKRLLKHGIFLLLSLHISNTFLAYIIGHDEILKITTHSPKENWGLFVAVIGFTLAFYWLYSYFREQFCTFLCPYARLQSVLLDNNSIVVAYDEKRGEPRGRRGKKTLLTKEDLIKKAQGDCVDCNICHQVCPTGIDIRNGFPQLECVNCSACIDACDEVMTRTKKPKGLISYTSRNKLEGKRFQLTGRIISYSTLLVFLVSVSSFLIATRSDVEFILLRARGSLPVAEHAFVKNLYTTKLINKSNKEQKVTVKLISHAGFIEPTTVITVAKGETKEFNFWVKIPRGLLNKRSTPIELQILNDQEIIESRNSAFLTP